MFTLFDLMKLVCALVGASYLGHFGYQAGGWLGMLAGASIGYVAGAFLGNLPWVASAAWMRRDLRITSTTGLKERLGRQYFLTHVLLAELARRGEPMEQFRGHVEQLLQSEFADKRRFGETSARLWFPDMLNRS